jgi:hypothetical protein
MKANNMNLRAQFERRVDEGAVARIGCAVTVQQKSWGLEHAE